MSNSNTMSKIHSTADVRSKKIGSGTEVWQYAVVLEGAVIGKNCNINCHTFIENEVVIGNNVTLKSGVYLWDGITIEDNVFIGPGAAFTNDLFPRSKNYPATFQRTLVKQGASIGANATILAGITIGAYSMVGAGAVVTKSVPDHAIVFGNPAEIKGWMDENGNKLIPSGEEWHALDGRRFKVENNQLIKI